MITQESEEFMFMAEENDTKKTRNSLDASQDTSSMVVCSQRRELSHSQKTAKDNCMQKAFKQDAQNVEHKRLNTMNVSDLKDQLKLKLPLIQVPLPEIIDN